MKILLPSAPAESDSVIKAADALGISEFDFFRLAYRRWAGDEPDMAKLERVFVDYMFHRTLPPAVRHLTRDVLAREREGRLDPAQLGARAFSRRHPLPKRRPLPVAAALLIMLVYGWGLMGISYDPDTSAPMECHYAPGFKALVEFAHKVHGRATPDCPAPERR